MMFNLNTFTRIPDKELNTYIVDKEADKVTEIINKHLNADPIEEDKKRIKKKGYSSVDVNYYKQHCYNYKDIYILMNKKNIEFGDVDLNKKKFTLFRRMVSIFWKQVMNDLVQSNARFIFPNLFGGYLQIKKAYKQDRNALIEKFLYSGLDLLLSEGQVYIPYLCIPDTIKGVKYSRISVNSFYIKNIIENINSSKMSYDDFETNPLENNYKYIIDYVEPIKVKFPHIKRKYIYKALSEYVYLVAKQLKRGNDVLFSYKDGFEIRFYHQWFLNKHSDYFKKKYYKKKSDIFWHKLLNKKFRLSWEKINKANSVLLQRINDNMYKYKEQSNNRSYNRELRFGALNKLEKELKAKKK